jgi:thymidylate synthase (FAD)
MISVLLKSKHLSVFEHSSASFYIDGISRSASHQLVRHRLSSYSQKSQRYVNERNFEYVIPESLNSGFNKIRYDNLMKELSNLYDDLMVSGEVLKEDIRMILPNACTTTLAMTSNFRQWLSVIDERVTPQAQWEIRNLLSEIWKQLYNNAPNVFGMTYFDKYGKEVEFKREIFNTFKDF